MFVNFRGHGSRLDPALRFPSSVGLTRAGERGEAVDEPGGEGRRPLDDPSKLLSGTEVRKLGPGAVGHAIVTFPTRVTGSEVCRR